MLIIVLIVTLLSGLCLGKPAPSLQLPFDGIHPERIPFICERTSRYNYAHILFVGDSHMHNQYLAFVYAMRHCNEESWMVKPSIVDHIWPTHRDMIKGSNNFLFPFETVDSYRNPAGFEPGKVFGNRYYIDPYRKLEVTYINFGWNFQDCQGRGSYKTVLNDTTDGFWRYNLRDTFLKFVPTLHSAPDIVVLNAGHFQNNFHNETYADEVVAAMRLVMPGAKLFWRTTTYGTEERQNNFLHPRFVLGERQNFFEVDAAMCERLSCLNISWTHNLPPEAWRHDGFHFYMYPYSWMNRQLFHAVFPYNDVV
jgi:hypothetical protein